MITLETGVPGAGKTLYCVDKLLRPLVGATIKTEDSDGNMVEVPRVIYTNINGLLLEHEKIGPAELDNWHTWAKPGSVIVFDEVQKPWPLTATGSKVPECIQALETHRHMGVDFILLTQHPMLIHKNIVQLVGRHLHIRRMGNMGLAVVYEWDSCSRTLLYKNALSKAPYKYSKTVFELYKSAEAHTKQPRRIPSLVWGALFGLVALLALSPGTVTRIKERISPPEKPPAAAAAPKLHAPGQPPATPAPNAPAPASSAPLAVAIVKPKTLGCIASKAKCSCFDAQGDLMDLPMAACMDDALTLKRIEVGSAMGMSSFVPPAPSTPIAAASAPVTSNGTSGWVDSKPQPSYSLSDVSRDFGSYRPPL